MRCGATSAAAPKAAGAERAVKVESRSARAVSRRVPKENAFLTSLRARVAQIRLAPTYGSCSNGPDDAPLAPFRALVEVPANNVYVLPQDTIYLYREPQTFLAFGALGIQQQIPFGTWRISLAEAVARSGGLPDNRADPASVFLYRGETREVASQLGIDVAKFEGPIVPVVYNLNLRDPAGYFLATTFEMRNKDVIYVSNAISVDATKWMNFFRTVNGTINDPINTAIQVYTLKNLISGGGLHHYDDHHSDGPDGPSTVRWVDDGPRGANAPEQEDRAFVPRKVVKASGRRCVVGAHFRKAILAGANLTGADLSDADLTRAILADTRF